MAHSTFIDTLSTKPSWNRLIQLLRILSWATFALVLVRTAWVCDDAYITFRCVDNAVNGYGPVYNPGERVQAFTHPLWMMLHLPFQALFHDPYWSTLILSMGLSLLTLRLLAKGMVSSSALLALPWIAISSKAFIEYSTSGLENPLTGLLLIAFTLLVTRTLPVRRHLFKLSLLAGLLILNRMDTILLVGPALAWAFWQTRSWRTLGQILLGLLPLLAWEIFALIYYGFPFPNTAYAKLGTGVETQQLLKMGFYYFHDSLVVRDPVTLPVIALGIIVGLFHRKQWPLVLGLVLYLVYIARIGGDFMSGRFFMAPFLLALFLIGKWVEGRWQHWTILAAVATIAGLSGPTPMLTSGAGYELEKLTMFGNHDIADERAFYYRGTGLLHAFEGRDMPDFRWVAAGKKLSKQQRQVHVIPSIGFIGYYAGPKKHLIDKLALADPLLARLPALYNFSPRPGHYPRLLPEGYERSLDEGGNFIQDPAIHQLYDKLNVITHGPIFSAERFRLIWAFNTNAGSRPSLDHLRIPTDTSFALPRTDTTTILLENNIGAKFAIPGFNPDSLEFDLEGGEGLYVIWMRRGKPMYSAEIWTHQRQKFRIPPAADTLILLPYEHWPPSEIRNLRVW